MITLDLKKKNTNNDFFSGIEKTMNTSIKGIFLLILTVASNFNAETLGCRTQKYLTESMFGKHLLNLALVYFAINLTSDEVAHPNTILMRTLYVWVGYMLFIRMPLNLTIVVFGLLLSAYTLGNYIDYYERDVSDEDMNDNLEKIIISYRKVRKYIFIMIPILIVGGMIIYFNQKKLEFGDEFDTYKFIFGNNTCKSME